jgi:hypothetical protein
VEATGIQSVVKPIKGTGTPEIGGLTVTQGIEIIRGCRGLKIIGGDLVELSPPYDTSGNTALVAANILYELVLQSSGSRIQRTKICRDIFFDKLRRMWGPNGKLLGKYTISQTAFILSKYPLCPMGYFIVCKWGFIYFSKPSLYPS